MVPPMQIRRAFTLIELLVVIAIIAILAAILFPVFSRAKEAAKQTTCLSNLKNIGMAFSIYGSDSDDMLPNTNVIGLWTGRRFRWPIMPYLGVGQKNRVGSQYDTDASSAMLYCPSDASRSSFNDTSYSYVSSLYRPPSFIASVTSLLQLAGDGPCPIGTCESVSFTQVAQPSAKVMVFEWVNAHNFGPRGPVGPWGKNTGFSLGPGFLEGRRNLTFVDGHSKSFAASQMSVNANFGSADPNLTPGGYDGSDLK